MNSALSTKADTSAMNSALSAKADSSALTGHTGNVSNPHSVTKAQVGLEFADNTADANKPISTATQTALNTKAPTSHATSATTYGVGSTTNYGHVKVDSILSTTSVNPVQNKAVKAELDTKALNTDLTSHATSKTNPHSVTKAQVGLSNVDNTSDASKPISSATQTALNDAKSYVDDKVKTDVPTGAIFTDTKYTHPATHPSSIIAQTSVARFVTDAEKNYMEW